MCIEKSNVFKNFMLKIFNTLKKFLQPNSGFSSKRLIGVIILLTELISINCRHKIDVSIENLHITLIYVGAGLLGLGILDKFKNL